MIVACGSLQVCSPVPNGVGWYLYLVPTTQYGQCIEYLGDPAFCEDVEGRRTCSRRELFVVLPDHIEVRLRQFTQ